MIMRIGQHFIFAALLSSMAVNADLIDLGVTTLDDATGLEWLDVNLTDGQTYNSIVVGGFGGYAAAGYVHATAVQLCELFGALGDDVTGCGVAGIAEGALSNASVETFVSLLGLVFGSTGTQGQYDSGHIGSNSMGAGCIAPDAAAPCRGDFLPGWITVEIWITSLDSGGLGAGHFLVRAATTPGPEPITLACDGFYSPLHDGPVTVKKNRALPFKGQLINSDNQLVDDLGIIALPVIQILFDSMLNGAVDVTDDALSAGAGTDGNQFEFLDGMWRFNLKTKNYSAPGTYTVTMDTGDDSEYVIDPICTGQFVIN